MYTIHRIQVGSAVVQAKASIKQEYDKEVLKATEEAIEKERKLVEEHLKETQIKNAKIKSINDKLNVVVNELRNRPGRSPESASTTAETGATCTGASLFREDGEFLAREAARADKILAERDYCYSEYERARQQLSN